MQLYKNKARIVCQNAVMDIVFNFMVVTHSMIWKIIFICAWQIIWRLKGIIMYGIRYQIYRNGSEYSFKLKFKKKHHPLIKIAIFLFLGK